MSTQLTIIAERLNIEVKEIESILMKTIMPSGGKSVTNDQFISFLTVANEYKLNPLSKEIYAFPSRGGIQPIVSIDGWLKIINQHEDFNGMELKNNFIENNIESVTCKIHVKGRDFPTEITEYFNECNTNTDQWKSRPIRMLRHKAVIQAARYAFGLSGIMDEDEAKRSIKESNSHQKQERDITPKKTKSETLSRLVGSEKKIQKTTEEKKSSVKYDIERWKTLLRSCASNDALMKIFEKAWKDAIKNGTDSDKKDVKEFYDNLKERSTIDQRERQTNN